jgi:type I restriction enzyme R subunit
VNIATHATRDIGPDGKQLSITEFRDYTAEVVRTLFRDLASFRDGWSNPDRRAEVLAALEEKSINPSEAGDALGSPDADPFDILCGIAWNAPVVTRKERAASLRAKRPDFFTTYTEPARQILDALLAKYAEHGPGEFSIPDSLKVPPISDLGNVAEITKRFGGEDQFRSAVVQLQQLLYAA